MCQCGSYSLLALPLAASGLVLYVGISDLAGVQILRVGQATSYSIPEYYVAAGVSGWAAMIVSVLGALSPVAAVIGVRRRPLGSVNLWLRLTRWLRMRCLAGATM